jgi:hypothetical protein
MNGTVYVLGAGASYEAKLPLGAGLTSLISKDLDLRYERGGGLIKGSATIDNTLRYFRDRNPDHFDLDELIHAAQHISEAMPLSASIDNFIDSHRNNRAITLCGKLAIATSILAAERTSLLYLDPSNFKNTIDFGRTSNTWYRPFFHSIQENCTLDELPRRLETISLIVFNYDRCIEHFLYHAFQTAYRVSSTDAAELVGAINILHPYGTVAPLPWQQESGTSYGGSATGNNLLKLIEGIRTFSEGVQGSASKVRDECQNCIAMAHRLVFLGFAFHPINMRFLFDGMPNGIGPRNNHKCYATFFERSKSDAAIVATQLDAALRGENNRIEVREDLTCAKLFDEYSLSLSLARR